MQGLQNQISVQIPPKEQEAIIRKLEEVYTALKPYMIALTVDERRQLPKMSDGNAPFVEKALRYAKTQPELAPPFLKVKEMDIDFKAVNDLSAILQVAHRICSDIDDTIKLAGSEAWMASLAYYNAVKLGAKMNVPGARSVYDDLSKRFEKRRSRTEGTPAEEA